MTLSILLGFLPFLLVLAEFGPKIIRQQYLIDTQGRRSDAHRLKELSEPHRYAVLMCFLSEAYQDTIDYLFDTYSKAINKVTNKADKDIEEFNRARRTSIRACLNRHKHLCEALISTHDDKLDLKSLLQNFPKHGLKSQIEEVDNILAGKYSSSLNLVADRFSHLRKLARHILNNLEFDVEPTGSESLLEALELVTDLANGKIRKLPVVVPLDFLPKKTQKAIVKRGIVDKNKYEAAIYTDLPEQVKNGNLAIRSSKRFGALAGLFVAKEVWEENRDDFFEKSKLPKNPNEVEAYLTDRLNQVYDYFLEREPENQFARADEDGWTLSTDKAEILSVKDKDDLDRLKSWLAQHMRVIKLPDLLIEVDNDLHFTDSFLPPSKQNQRTPDDIINRLITLMTYGCNIGPKIMPELIEGISYKQIKRIYDWQFSIEALRQSLASVVNGISNIEITKHWGEGKTAASDGQRHSYRRKTIHRTYSHKFNSFAIEFYTFVADNFAPFHNLAKEATDRDSSKILDGHLYNVSDLEIEEHYTDTHGYTEINFAACAMLGIDFSPRIKNIKKQWIYKIDPNRDYGSLKHLVEQNNRTAQLNPIVDNWDRMAHFYASIKLGKVTASTGLKRITSLNSKNNFYKANLWLGRILKTEHILRWMADPLKRRRTRRGLLKVEQVHGLARDILYGNRGRLKGKDLEAHTSSANCLTLIIGSIVYWQAKEMSRVIKEYDAEASGINIEMIEHVSPIEWSNVILYGEYKLNRDLVEA